jgi:hypothetical protein
MITHDWIAYNDCSSVGRCPRPVIECHSARVSGVFPRTTEAEGRGGVLGRGRLLRTAATDDFDESVEQSLQHGRGRPGKHGRGTFVEIPSPPVDPLVPLALVSSSEDPVRPDILDLPVFLRLSAVSAVGHRHPPAYPIIEPYGARPEVRVGTVWRVGVLVLRGDAAGITVGQL